jgi:uncharacterized protein YecT (DUF1311 family)
MRPLIIAVIVLAAAASGHAQSARSAAQNDPAYDACTQKNSSTRGIVECGIAGSGRWDKRLNAAYQRIMASPDWSVATKTLLRDAQRAWLAYKTAKCRAAGELEYEGGTASEITTSICDMDETALRATELERVLTTR